MNKAKQLPKITIESIWREADPRFTRYVKVVGLVGADGSRQSAAAFPDVALDLDGKVAIVRCDQEGRTTGRVTYAAVGRFGRSGGYKPVDPAIGENHE